VIRSLAAFLALALLLCAGASAQQAPFDVDGSVALASLVSLADNHLRTMVDTLETIAATPEAASGDWAQIKAPLEEAASVNVPAVLYYGRADGTYWTTDRGKQSATLSDRPYFQRALAGQRTVGDLVTSKSTGKAVAVVVVPVVGKNGAVTGLLGGSIYLDKLSTLLATEMHVGPGMLFWAIDPQGKIALHSDTSNIFAEPGKMSPELQRVMADMLAHDRGTDTYTFRGQKRTVIYEKSPLTGWRYGFGVTR
jgi:methyl-accepting chemotaxis protein